jgi:hypothetical protein
MPNSFSDSVTHPHSMTKRNVARLPWRIRERTILGTTGRISILLRLRCKRIKTFGGVRKLVLLRESLHDVALACATIFDTPEGTLSP